MSWPKTETRPSSRVSRPATRRMSVDRDARRPLATGDAPLRHGLDGEWRHAGGDRRGVVGAASADAVRTGDLRLSENGGGHWWRLEWLGGLVAGWRAGAASVTPRGPG